MIIIIDNNQIGDENIKDIGNLLQNSASLSILDLGNNIKNI
jgi:hypothetical protein